MNIFTQFFVIIFVFAFFVWNAFAEINMTVSPIKYEIEVDPGDIITRTATLFNFSDKILNIATSQWEFEADGTSGKPRLLKSSAENSVASWITLHTEDFTIAPNVQKTISFDVLIPDNARPGWHYAAVFFENNNSANWLWTNIGINVDYGVLLLITVSWDIVVDWDVDEWDIIVKNSWSSWWWGWYSRKKDNCPVWDFSKSNFDNKCIDNLLTSEEPNDIEDEITFEKLDIAFEIPFDNNWNTHIKPTGKVTLKDEDGRQINQIWKQVILNEKWAIIWERIVDFIPINDIGWNVLPQTKRIFEWEWKGFPYKTHDDNGEEIVLYWSPDEYYSRKNIPENITLNFWERILERSNKKKVTADIHVAYTDLKGEEIEFNSAEDFYIEYVDTYVWFNKYIILIWSILTIFIIFFFYVWYRKKKKCTNCSKKIHKDLIICPYCGKKQKKLKEKIIEIKENISEKIKLEKALKKLKDIKKNEGKILEKQKKEAKKLEKEKLVILALKEENKKNIEKMNKKVIPKKKTTKKTDSKVVDKKKDTEKKKKK